MIDDTTASSMVFPVTTGPWFLEQDRATAAERLATPEPKAWLRISVIVSV